MLGMFSPANANAVFGFLMTATSELIPHFPQAADEWQEGHLSARVGAQ